ncbi:S-adenosyl-L-methionine-dependent methyltransferase [Chytriomyces sp. MP71]|nr:S-adenosyl-L-methionine-dependent methyltransferase [Chytriomyces sp. MP71]
MLAVAAHALCLYLLTAIVSPVYGAIGSETLTVAWILFFVSIFVLRMVPLPGTGLSLSERLALTSAVLSGLFACCVGSEWFSVVVDLVPSLANVSIQAADAIVTLLCAFVALPLALCHVRSVTLALADAACAAFVVNSAGWINTFVQDNIKVWIGSALTPAQCLAMLGLGCGAAALLLWVAEPPSSRPPKEQGDKKGTVKEAASKSSYTPSLVVLALSLAYYQYAYIAQFSPTAIPPPTASKNQQIIAKAYSNTGHISVVRDPTLHGGVQVLRCDHSLLGGIFLGEGIHGDSVYGSFYFLGFVSGFERPSLDGLSMEEMKEHPFRVLNIGLGIGVASKTFLAQHPQSHIDVLELDPVVLRFAVDHFNYPNTTHTSLIAGDGRAFLENAPEETYDYVLHDVFTNGGIATRLVSLEALQHVRRVLKPDGILALNFAGALHSTSTLSLLETLRALFPHTAVYPETAVDPAQPQAFHNMALLASAHPLDFSAARIPDPHARASARKKTTSDGGSMGYMRARMLEDFPGLRVEVLEKRGDGGAGVVIRDGFEGVDAGVVELIRVEERASRAAHAKVMEELMGREFWRMF